MALEPTLQQRLESVIEEQLQRETLRQHGFGPMRKLLLVGAPGTGKTMSASALAGELALPLFTIQLHGLITKFMGETAKNIQSVFEHASETGAMLFFDEADTWRCSSYVLVHDL